MGSCHALSVATGDQALLPEGFRFGVATAGFQVEGGFNRPGEPANNWLWWEHSGRAAPSGVAGDFWRSPEPVLDRAASLGCDTFGLSIEWARIEPAEGAVDTSALDHYASILAACVERGLQPVVTLHHFTHPVWLGEEFWLTPGSPDRFAAHVARVVPTLSAHCHDWVTINEPNVLAVSGWMLGTFPPGRYLAAADALAVADNLMAAHVLAYATIRAVQPEATVTVNPAACSAYDLDRLLTDLVAARSMGIAADRVDEWIDERRALHDALYPPDTPGERVLRGVVAAASHYGTAAPVPGLGRAGTWARDRLRRPSPERALDLVYESAHERTVDVVGFDWFDPAVSPSPRLRRHRTAGGPWWEAIPGPVGGPARPRGHGPVVRRPVGPLPRRPAVAPRERDEHPDDGGHLARPVRRLGPVPLLAQPTSRP